MTTIMLYSLRLRDLPLTMASLIWEKLRAQFGGKPTHSITDIEARLVTLGDASAATFTAHRAELDEAAMAVANLKAEHAREMRRACLEFCASYEAEFVCWPDLSMRDELIRNAGLSAAVAGELTDAVEGFS